MTLTSENALAPAAQTPPKIGHIKSHRQPAFVGKRQARYGFGADCSPAFVDALYEALAADDWILNFPWDRHPKLAANDSQTGWLGSVRGLLTDIPSSAVKLQDIRLDPVSQYVDLLQPGLMPVITIDRVVSGNGPATDLSGPIEPWRYANFAGIVWYGLAPHLRTREMLDQNSVWCRLRELFQGFQSFVGRRPDFNFRHRRREQASFILAVYERTCALLWEQYHRLPRYREDISQRRPTDPIESDFILALPTASVNDDNVAEARAVRATAYEELLLHTFANCHASLSCLR